MLKHQITCWKIQRAREKTEIRKKTASSHWAMFIKYWLDVCCASLDLLWSLCAWKLRVKCMKFCKERLVTMTHVRRNESHLACNVILYWNEHKRDHVLASTRILKIGGHFIWWLTQAIKDDLSVTSSKTFIYKILRTIWISYKTVK